MHRRPAREEGWRQGWSVAFSTKTEVQRKVCHDNTQTDLLDLLLFLRHSRIYGSGPLLHPYRSHRQLGGLAFFGIVQRGLGRHPHHGFHAFLVSGIWHVVLNWKPLVNYIRDSSRKVSFVKAEFVVSLVITLAFCLGAYLHVPPFGSILTGLDNVKVYWENEYGSPPWGHAELASIKTFTQKMGLDMEDSMAVLTAAGYREVSPKILMKDLAAANSTSPKHILELLQTRAKKAGKNTGGAAATEMTAPTGLGRLTLQQMADKAGVDVAQAIRRLEKKLAVKARADSKVKEIATQTGETPSAIWEMVRTGAGN
jgi:hypothetical protein